MANSREAQLKWDITKVMTVRGWKAGAANGYGREVEVFAELELTYYRLTKQEQKRMRLEEAEGDFGLTPFSEVSSGKPHDLNKQRLAFHYRFDDLYGIQVSDDDKLRFAGIADRIERDEAVMAQVRNHSEDLVIRGLFPKKVSGAVLNALSDHEKLSMPLPTGVES